MEFGYEVAFSLLDRDLALAEEIASLLRDRAEVFLYSERQLELAGSDGLEEFTSVFRRDARGVVVLCRGEWGSTKWTRIEETAIKNRGFDEGWDFLVVVPLDGGSSIPDWVPSTHIWADLERLGTSGLAAIIERKLEERGSAVRPESAKELADRLRREKEEQTELRGFLGSSRGVEAADAEAERLFVLLEQRSPELDVDVRRFSGGRRGVVITKDGRSVSVSWHRNFGNTLNESQLWVKLWDGVLSDHVSHEFRAEHAVSELPVEFTRVAGEIGWRPERSGEPCYTAEELADHCLKVVLRASVGEAVRL